MNSVIIDLLENIQRYDFFQLARICRHYHQALPNDIRFSVAPQLAFPVADVERVSFDKDTLQFLVSFIGLVGQSGVLPEHDTETVLAQLRQKEPALIDFLDIFHHRIIELLYLIWAQSNLLPTNAKTKQCDHGALLEPFCGQVALSEEEGMPLHTRYYYAGLWGKRHAPTESLCQMLTDYFGMPFSIENFSGRWVEVEAQQQTVIGKHRQYNALGVHTVMGHRIWHVQNHFDVLVGLVNYRQLLNLLPNGDIQPLLRKTIFSYVGIEFSFNIRVKILKTEVPAMCLNGESQLGWTSLLSQVSPRQAVLEIKLSECVSH